ncbi:MAG: TMEM175 family protein [Candidatus Limnocylindria bacterium]
MGATDGAGALRFERVVFFSDAVCAIAATRLVIDLRPPNVTDPLAYEAALRETLGHPLPFIAVAIGFVVVGSFWMSHRAIFSLIRATSGALIWTNLILLFWVAIQPFFTAALADFEPNRTSVLAYAVCQVLAGAAQLALWAVAVSTPGLLTERATPRLRRYVWLQLTRTPIAFAVSIPIAFVAPPSVAMASWGLGLLLGLVFRMPFRDVAGGPDRVPIRGPA